MLQPKSRSEKGSQRKFAGFWRVSAVSRYAAIHDRKFKVLVLSDRFHHHQTFAALGMYVSLADKVVVRRRAASVSQQDTRVFRKSACVFVCIQTGQFKDVKTTI